MRFFAFTTMLDSPTQSSLQSLYMRVSRRKSELTTYQDIHYLSVSSFKRIKILELLIFLVDNCQAPMCFFVNWDKYLKSIMTFKNIVSNPNKC